MNGDNSNPFSQESLRSAFAGKLGLWSLPPVEQDFIDQAFDDARADELPGDRLETLGVILARAWASAASLGVGPKILLETALDTNDQPLNLDVLVVAQPDAPFLVDSVMGELAEGGYDVRAMFHPVVSARRNGKGERSDTGEERR